MTRRARPPRRAPLGDKPPPETDPAEREPRARRRGSTGRSRGATTSPTCSSTDALRARARAPGGSSRARSSGARRPTAARWRRARRRRAAAAGAAAAAARGDRLVAIGGEPAPDVDAGVHKLTEKFAEALTMAKLTAEDAAGGDPNARVARARRAPFVPAATKPPARRARDRPRRGRDPLLFAPRSRRDQAAALRDAARAASPGTTALLRGTRRSRRACRARPPTTASRAPAPQRRPSCASRSR